MFASHSREDQLLKKLQSCVGKLDINKKCPNESTGRFKNKENNLEHQYFSSQQNGLKNNSVKKQERIPLGQFSNNYVASFQQKAYSLKPNIQVTKQTHKSRQNRDLDLSYDCQQRSGYRKQDYTKQKINHEIPKYRQKYQLSKIKQKQNSFNNYQAVSNFQNFDYKMERRPNRYEENISKRNNYELEKSQSKDKQFTNQYDYKRINLNQGINNLSSKRQNNYHPQKSTNIKHFESDNYDKKQTRSKQYLGKYEYDTGERSSNTHSAYKQRRMSMKNQLKETSNDFQYQRRGLGIGSIASTSSKRNSLCQKNLNASYNYRSKASQNSFNQKYRANRDQSQTNGYSGSKILKWNSKQQGTTIRNQSVLPLSLSSLKKSDYKQRSYKLSRDRSSENQKNLQKDSKLINTNIEGLRNLKDEAIVEIKQTNISSLNVDTMQKLKKINDLNDKINMRIKNIIESFDTK